ncbi:MULTISPECIES: SpaH/EbpB family LPXTG-anchored major pilin [unclassified Leucobacter]|uniref:SpaH/EbpB family LPXTG-anchored major pilin n=1 Tax=unclassified Leucobacter TaxID=2621730 RepID=UPI00165E6839|nr:MULTISPECIES: SpaH/EbpB family LPXTG-anchored major pilin [unclassified Leucobacter]MBC9927726.1 SpaH/EbpB family LPXTG-anchored major pilin [Leucobacter sp. cx-169]MBC9937409.1 SpaH/EbpB family LPXTG-anchored major pilin [Leucobacter sp. cx-87]
MKNHKTSRVAALLGAFALSAAALTGGATAAFAEPPSFGNIDFSKPGSLTVHKYLHQTGTPTVGDISAAPDADDYTNPVAGVEFTVYPLLTTLGAEIDLEDPATWDSLNAIVPGAGCTAPAGYSIGTGQVMPLTSATGTATQALPIGVYMVCETDAPSNIVDRAAPFVLTVPMPHENGWVYDVHAFPKNGAGTLVKTVKPIGPGTGLGSTLTFPVTMTIPQQENAWTKFEISDALDARLEPVGTGVQSVKVGTQVLDASYYSVGAPIADNTVKVTFTPAGIAWLNATPKDAQAGSVITIEFVATVVSIGSGVIENVAQFSNTPGQSLDSNPVTTRWGSIEVLKRAAGTLDANGVLKGAEFEVYNADLPYAPNCGVAKPVENEGPISVGGATKFVSDANGVVTIPGLFVSDSVNTSINASQRCYVLKETKAPAGYVLPSSAFTPVQVKTGVTTIASNFNPVITNTQQDVPELPLTGAAGQVLLVAAGIAGVAIAGGLMLVNRRRTRAQL